MTEPKAQEMTTHNLTPEEAATMEEFAKEVFAIQQRAQGALITIMRLRGLKGNWSYDEAGRRLVKAE